MRKQKFITPKINLKETRRLYEKAVDKHNSQFYDEEGKFIRLGSKKLSIKHKEIFLALCAVMNNRLKRRNLSSIYDTPTGRNYYTNPFIFLASTADIQNMLMQGSELKKEDSRETIKRALYRFLRDAKVNDQGFIQMLRFSRSKSRYYIQINPELINFQELATLNENASVSDLKKSKNTNCAYYTTYNDTLLKNNKSNRTDFNRGENSQANFPINNLNKTKKEQGRSVTDNRTIDEKRKDFEDKIAEISAKIKNSGDKRDVKEISGAIRDIIPKPKKTKRFDVDKIKKINNDFCRFKQKVILDFYIFMINLLWSKENAQLYSPYNLESPVYVYTEQSLKELENNDKYFGLCKTIEDFENKRKLLENSLMRMKKGWVNKRISFNTEYLFPNRFLNGSYNNMKFEHAIIYHVEKEKKKGSQKKIKALKKISNNQYNALFNKLVNHIQKGNNVKDEIVQNYFMIYAGSEGEYKLKPKQYYSKQEIYQAMQFYFS